MIQIYLSRPLAQRMKSLLAEELDIQPDGMHWYAQWVSLEQGNSIVMMEEYSRYTMLFSGKEIDHPETFSKTFRDRLWREVMAVCMLDDDETKNVLGALVDQLSIQQIYRQGSNASVTGHLRDVVERLEEESNNLGRLPVNDEESFGFGLRVNDCPRHRKGRTEAFRPLQLFSESWLSMLEFSFQQIRTHLQADSPNNVIAFDPARRH